MKFITPKTTQVEIQEHWITNPGFTRHLLQTEKGGVMAIHTVKTTAVSTHR